ncbi:MAG: NAD(P)-dependent oxidoreductase [Akkermansia muciniphila]
MKDWTGNKRTLGALLGASNHTSEDRQREDYYATHPDMVRDLLNAGAPLRQQVWEPACGAGHIVNVLRERGHEVYATDIVDRGCPDSSVLDFLWEFAGAPMGDVDIMTNPPYATALEFVERALRLVKPGANVWMLLKLSFLEGKGRKRLFNDTPPADVWVFSERRICAKNGDFDRYKAGAMAYAWFHWVKSRNTVCTIKWL